MPNTPNTTPEPGAGNGFSLVMALEEPGKLVELMGKLDAKGTRDNIRAALHSLDYVHYARFLPLWDHGLLLIVTEFDGVAEDYVMDFAAALNDEFSLILSYMKGRPPLPIGDHPAEFWEYVDRNIKPSAPFPEYDQPFSAYPDVSVLQILGAKRPKSLPTPPPRSKDKVDLSDIQAHMLRGYSANHAAHVGIRFAAPEEGRAFMQALDKDERLRVTPASHLKKGDANPKLCVNFGFTHAGLEALGLPFEILQRFPKAFREGPRLRAKRLGDEGPSAPSMWRVGGIKNGVPCEAHAMLSLYAKDEDVLIAALEDLTKSIQHKSSGVELAFPIERVGVLDKFGTVHFDYRDSISQPRFDGVSDPERGTLQPSSPIGDFVLGAEYRNSRGGCYIGTLPVDLAQNATYAALRVIEQDAAAFENFLDRAYDERGIDRELLAAKLMGRWRGTGLPLATTPVPTPRATPGCPMKPADLGTPEMNDFDYLEPRGADDLQGKRCPIGAHIRRLNPRSGMVVGIPWGRRVIRRGMPYGARYDHGRPTEESRGLVGLFICGDLESQFEFLQRVWANQDLSAPGIRGTREPFASGRSTTTPFRFCASESATEEITVDVPPLTRTAGSLYLLMPGISGLKWIARAGWKPPASKETQGDHAVDISKFDPSDPLFHADPYPYYKAMRAAAPVKYIGKPWESYWVTSHALVKEVCEKKTVFLKPGKNRETGKGPFSAAAQFGDGLFFMDPPRHTEVRKMMDEAFAVAIGGAETYAQKAAEALLAGSIAKGTMDLVGDYAGPLPMQVFMKVMGIPFPEPAQDVRDVPDSYILDQWNRAALEAHDPMNPNRIGGGTATMAMRAYFLAHALEKALKTPTDHLALIGGMKDRTGCPASAMKMTPFEAMNTAVHFALGGYLSTEFLLSTGVYTLLRHPDQWKRLREQPKLMRGAVREMLRYEAPFQMADRWVDSDTTLGGVALPAGSKVTVVYGAANRDETVFVDPDRFDIERKEADSADNFGFGHGIHYCVGEPLALTVAEVALLALLKNCPVARIDHVGPWSADPYFRTLKSLKLLLG